MFLDRLHIKNFRAIREMSLDFTGSDGARRWTVLLGENGCGKSSVLKAIALALIGSEALPDLIGEVDEWVRNGSDHAELRAFFSTREGEAREASLMLRRGATRDAVIKENSAGLDQLDRAIRKADRNYFIAGYGAFRRPPSLERSGSMHFGGVQRSANVATMFSASKELVSLEQWAMDLDYRQGAKGLKVVEKALNTLLPGMAFSHIDKRRRGVIMKTVDGDVPLLGLSEGYQAMAAWAGDILYRMSEIFGDHAEPLHARGVLLIDEMDLHLHPVWKRRFVDFLDDAFPNLQIIATTHSPLSVQQCGEGELYVIRREADAGPTLVPFVGDPSRLRLSELFLSPLIGLETLDSPKVEALRDEARRIELKKSGLTAAEKKRLAVIAEELEGTAALPAAEMPGLANLVAFQARVQQEIGALLPRQAQADGVPPAVPARKRAGARKPAAKPARGSSAKR